MSSSIAPDNLANVLMSGAQAMRPEATAFIDAKGVHTYGALSGQIDRSATAFAALGLAPGDRILLCMLDSAALVAAFLGAIKCGVVPVLLNTLFTASDYAYLLEDAAPRAILVSESLWPVWRDAIGCSGWTGEILRDGEAVEFGVQGFAPDLAAPLAPTSTHPAQAEDIAFWLYSSGSTGRPKGVLHRHSSAPATAELFARQVLGLTQADVVYSAAKLFFAYGLGNALTFPLSVGAATVLYPDRATPEAVCRLLLEHKVTVFCGVPTLFAALLASPHMPKRGFPALRLCTSAGEALPEALGLAWKQATGVDIIDGIGSTEMLHIYVSNRPGAVFYGTTGHPVPGYETRLMDEAGGPATADEMGELWVRGPSMTTGYWNQAAKTAETFVGGWMRTGDKFYRNPAGALVHCGRADDMLKISGIWVSPAEVENALLAHAAVLEAAVIGVPDADDLIKTKAFVVLKPGFSGDEAKRAELQAFVKGRLAPHKYPRIIAFVDDLPKTTTGKLRRHILREREGA